MKGWGIVVAGLAWGALIAPASAQSSDPIGDIIEKMR